MNTAIDLGQSLLVVSGIALMILHNVFVVFDIRSGKRNDVDARLYISLMFLAAIALETLR